MSERTLPQSNQETPGAALPGRSWTRWILPVVSLLVLVTIGSLLNSRLKNDVWAFYTDDEGLKVDAQAKKERMVLWEDPRERVFQQPPVDPANAPTGQSANRSSQRVEAAFSANGAMMVLTRWSKDLEKTEPVETGGDLYLSNWNGRTWSRPLPLVHLNTEANERGAAFSHDGKHLFFSSDRQGGAGGYDLYVARFNGQTWTAVERLGDSINSAGNETGPAPAADDSQLFFSSDRQPGVESQDIFVASRIEVKKKDLQSPNSPETTKSPGNPDPSLSPVPLFSDATAVNVLNSSADDIEAALTGRGAHVFLASDRDRRDQTGFKLYLSRVIKGKMQPPQLVDVYIKKGDATDPAVRMEGFDLLFSANVELKNDPEAATPIAEPGYGLFQTTTREVIGYTDLSDWELFKTLMSKIIWWILLAIAALIAIIYLLEKWQDITNLYHKCLAGSAMVHLLLLLFLSYWLISQALESGQQQAQEVAVSIDNLAEEELAMESEQELAQVSRSTQLIVDKNIQEFREVQFDATEAETDPIPVPRKTTDQSLLTDFTPSKRNQAKATPSINLAAPSSDSPLLQELSPAELPGLEINELEIGEMANAKPVEPVDPTEGDFKPENGDIKQVKTTRGQTGKDDNQKLDVQSDSKSVTTNNQPVPTTDTGGETVNPTDGLQADVKSPSLEGVTNKPLLAMNLPGKDTIDELSDGIQLELPKDNPNVENLGQYIKKLRGKPSMEVIEQLGGSDATERAIGMALDWFTNHQEPQGHWDMGKHGGHAKYDTAGTGLALLCYYGWGIKHGESSRHAVAQNKALTWLLNQQKEDGDLRGTQGGRMYCHGIAAIALCEAYGLTRDAKLKEPANRAVQFILDAQHAQGGWRYKPGEAGDLSVTGWQYMALHSARMADLPVPDQSFANARKFIDSVSGGKTGGRYGYTGKGNGPPAMTATGMFMRQLDLSPPTATNQQESAAYLKANMLKANRVDFYYDYYATLALYQHQGPIWQEWNTNMKEVYLALQHANGTHKGSWDPKGNHVNQGGRVLATGLAVLSLEVYYRLLPMYGFGRD